MDLNAWLSNIRLVACVGSGGVGKTTTAAAVGLWGATQGRKVIVLTIDPAKRLANSLGIERMGGEPVRIDLSPLIAGGIPVAEGGELHAMMLDSRGTFDALIAAVAPSPEARDRILANHVYRAMADALAGSQDYMATEKLYDLVRTGRWDLVVLDTPPVQNALDFLEAPGRVVRFLDEKILGRFLAPIRDRKGGGSWASWLLAGPSAVLYRLLSAIFGQEFLDDFAEFLEDFNGLYEGFRTRHLAVEQMLRSPETAFVTICAPNDPSVNVAVFFEQELRRRGLPRAGVVVNQVHHVAPIGYDEEEALRMAAGPDVSADVFAGLMERLKRAHRRLADRVAEEQQLADRVRQAGAGSFYQEVPRLDGEVHDLLALHRVGHFLFGSPAVWLHEREDGS